MAVILADNIFKCIFLKNEKFWTKPLNKISLKFIPKVLIENNPALV